MLDQVIEGDDIEAGRVYDLDEFVRVEKGVIPSTLLRWLFWLHWEIDTTILLSKGVSSA